MFKNISSIDKLSKLSPNMLYINTEGAENILPNFLSIDKYVLVFVIIIYLYDMLSIIDVICIKWYHNIWIALHLRVLHTLWKSFSYKPKLLYSFEIWNSNMHSIWQWQKKINFRGEKTFKNLLPFIKTKALAKFKLKTSAGQLSEATVYPLPTEVDNQIWQYTMS